MNIFGLSISWALAESVTTTNNLLPAGEGPYGDGWVAVGSDQDDVDKSGIFSEAQHREARQRCRLLARTSAHCINALANRQSYIVGYGHTYTATQRKGFTASEQEIAGVQEAIDAFVKANRWQCLQREIQRRIDRDGECFLRYFNNADGVLRVRYVEPGQVSAPADATEFETWGIKTDPADVQTVLAYCIDGVWVDAEEIQHRKASGTDSNVKRGMPLMYPVRDILNEIRNVGRNMGKGSTIQTAVAYTKTVKNATGTTLASIRDNAASTTRANPLTGKTDSVAYSQGGVIPIKTDNLEYNFPFADTDYSAFVEVVKALLREIASMLVMPEFMFTSDASNGNYASTMVAEGPAVRNFEGLQYEMRMYDMEVFDRHIRASGLPEDILERVEIDVQCPQLAVREPLADTQRRQILANNRVLSPQTWAAEEGYDYAQEQDNIEQHMEDHPDANAGPLGGDPGGLAAQLNAANQDKQGQDGGDPNAEDPKTKAAKEWIEGLEGDDGAE